MHARVGVTEFYPLLHLFTHHHIGDLPVLIHPAPYPVPNCRGAGINNASLSNGALARQPSPTSLHPSAPVEQQTPRGDITCLNHLVLFLLLLLKELNLDFISLPFTFHIRIYRSSSFGRVELYADIL
jgi:hypothetical protein